MTAKQIKDLIRNQAKKNNIDTNCSLLAEAFKATSAKRSLVVSYENILPELEKVLMDTEIKRLWGNYRKKFSYAGDLEWDQVEVSLRKLFAAVKEAVKK